LLLLRFAAENRVVRVGVFSLLVMWKITFALPAIAYLAWKGCRTMRLALAGAVVTFAVLNVAVVKWIGLEAFKSHYSANVRELNASGGVNDPWGPMRGARVDLQATVAEIARGPAAVALSWMITLALGVGFVLRFRASPGLDLDSVSLIALISLSTTLHRSYDAVLMIPSLFFLWSMVRAGKWGVPSILLGASLLVLVLSLGNHNVLDILLSRMGTVQPHAFRSLMVLVACFAQIVRPRPVYDSRAVLASRIDALSPA
ncbi:MAG: hypothetical protein JWP03_5245, partial [Phycisphaerales bacterium]|nr:hypothetical protein [Phycisphaerales bacterium]